MIKRITLLAVMALILTALPIMTVGAQDDVIHPALTPAEVDEVLFPGQSVEIDQDGPHGGDSTARRYLSGRRRNRIFR